MRLDSYLCQNNYYTSRAKASQAIERGEVFVNGKVQKPAYSVAETDKIEICLQQRFVSVGGYKIEKALRDFELNVEGLTIADVGASTGGFTDCLLQNGAKKVYAIDVGESLLDKRLVADERVVVVDNTNVRFATSTTLPELCDGAVCDCSFISLKQILQPIKSLIKPNGFIVALIKPQFECEKKGISKRGIVTDKKVLYTVCTSIFNFAKTLGLNASNFTNAPIKTKKNTEFLIKFCNDEPSISQGKIDEILKSIGAI